MTAKKPTEAANALRFLAMDAVEQAKSGHPGAPLGMADIAKILWVEFLKHNPKNPCWPDRDRFVLSNGHGSMLLYAALHLSGYDLSLDDLKNFRRLGSKTPGHPEHGVTPGVEISTGPLGQGIASAVGMALAERLLAAEFNRPGHEIVDHWTYVFMGDGCLMEGLSHEACSLAGTMKLGKLVAFWDDNGISIDGHVGPWFGEDVAGRFEAYGWHVVRGVDGHDEGDLRAAIHEARAQADRPSLLCCRTVIGFGAPNVCGTHDCHGSPLGPAEIEEARKNLGWEHPPFTAPFEVYRTWDARARGAQAEASWRDRFESYRVEHPDLAQAFENRAAGLHPKAALAALDAHIADAERKAAGIATRKASQLTLDAFGPHWPGLFGGSADLTSSNLTNHKASRKIGPGEFTGDYCSYGVREFGMAAAMNGLALHGGFTPYGGTFLVFSDYAKNALRMAAMMGLNVVHVLTHDSIGVGEDGPTHQPVEHVASLRLIPNMSVWRPADAVETAVAWKSALTRGNGPTCLVLSRQNLPHNKRTAETRDHIARGGYILHEASGRIEVVLMASGSELHLAVRAREALEAEGVGARVVSMPSMDRFDAQPEVYKRSILPKRGQACVAVEAGSPDSWWKYVGPMGAVIGMTGFGESAPGDVLFNHFGFTVDNVVRTAKRLLARRRGRSAATGAAA